MASQKTFKPSRSTSNFGNASGFTLTEVMISTVFIVLAGLLAITASIMVNQQMQRSAALSLAIGLQSEILVALQEETQFQDASGNPTPQITALRGGDCNAAVGLQLRSNDSDKTVIAIVGHRIGFTIKKQHCDPSSDECPVRVDLNFYLPPVGIADANCVADYRVSLSPKVIQIQTVPFGAPFKASFLRYLSVGLPHAVARESNTAIPKIPLSGIPHSGMAGTVPVNYDISKQLAKAECPTTDGLFITKMERTTGTVDCARRNTSLLCKPGELMKGLKVEKDELIPKLVPICQPMQVAQCSDPDYIWHGIDLSLLDGNPGIPNTTYRCTYRWRDNVGWQRSSPVGAQSFSMRFCNPYVYHPVSNGTHCQTVVTHQSPGTCYQPCNCQTDAEGNTSCDSCPYVCYPSFNPPSESLDYNSGMVSCSIGSKNEPGGSSISGYVSWSGGRCVINRAEHPEFKP